MPDRGLLNISTLDGLPALDDSRADWKLTGVRWCQATFEVDRDAVLSVLPCDVSRPIPCYARLFIAVAEGGPHGAMGVAILSAGSRNEMMPRNVVVQRLVDGPVAAAERAFGGPVQRGKITLERADGGVIATVADETRALATVRLPDLRPIDDAMLRWDPWLGYAQGPEGPEMIELGLKAMPRAPFLSRKSQVEPAPGLPRTDIWNRFRNLNTISACFVEGDLTLQAARLRAAAV